MSKNLPKTPKTEEVDLIQIFNLIGNAFKSLFNFIYSILQYIFKLFIIFSLFIRRHLLKLVAAAVIGFVAGSVVDYFFEPFYSSTLIVKPNFGSNEQLIENTRLFAQLAGSKDSVALGRLLEITPEKAGKIKGIAIRAKENANDKLLAFNNFIKQADSLTIKATSFEKFEKSLSLSDYPYYIITVDSDDKFIFKEIEHKFIDISVSDYVKNLQKIELENIKAREIAINKTLKKVDSLRRDYREVMMNEIEQKDLKSSSNGTNFYMGTNNLRATNELELFSIEKQLNNELLSLARDRVNKEHVVNVSSSFQDPGVYIKKSMRNWYVLGALILAILILLALGFNKFLDKYEDQLKIND